MRAFLFLLLVLPTLSLANLSKHQINDLDIKDGHLTFSFAKNGSSKAVSSSKALGSNGKAVIKTKLLGSDNSEVSYQLEVKPADQGMAFKNFESGKGYSIPLRFAETAEGTLAEILVLLTFSDSRGKNKAYRFRYPVMGSLDLTKAFKTKFVNKVEQQLENNLLNSEIFSSFVRMANGTNSLACSTRLRFEVSNFDYNTRMDIPQCNDNQSVLFGPGKIDKNCARATRNIYRSLFTQSRNLCPELDSIETSIPEPIIPSIRQKLITQIPVEINFPTNLLADVAKQNSFSLNAFAKDQEHQIEYPIFSPTELSFLSEALLVRDEVNTDNYNKLYLTYIHWLRQEKRAINNNAALRSIALLPEFQNLVISELVSASIKNSFYQRNKVAEECDKQLEDENSFQWCYDFMTDIIAKTLNKYGFSTLLEFNHAVNDTQNVFRKEAAKFLHENLIDQTISQVVKWADFQVSKASDPLDCIGTHLFPIKNLALKNELDKLLFIGNEESPQYQTALNQYANQHEKFIQLYWQKLNKVANSFSIYWHENDFSDQIISCSQKATSDMDLNWLFGNKGHVQLFIADQ